MNKEQDEFKLVKILNKYFPDILLETLSECANEIIQAGYVQLQADSEGLVENPYKVQLPASQAEFDAAKQRYEEAKKFYGKEADRGEFDTFREQLIIDNALARAYEEGCKAQKAVDDSVSPHDKYLKAKEYLLNKIDELEQEKAEAVKKVALDIYNSIREKQEEYEYFINEHCLWEIMKKFIPNLQFEFIDWKKKQTLEEK